MGAIIGKIFRRKTSTRDVLAKIRDDIQDIEEFKQSTQAWHKKLIGYLLAYFSVIYLIAALVAYFKYFTNPSWRDFTSQLQLLTPFIVAPFIFVFLKRFLTWWYHRKIRRNEIALEKLKKQKAKLLDEVMENETYKVAKELLDEFASNDEKRVLNLVKSPALNSTSRSKSMFENSKLNQTAAAGTELRKRTINPTGAPGSPAKTAASSIQDKSMISKDSTTLQSSSPIKRPDNINSIARRPASNTPIVTRTPPGPPLPRPVLPRERGYMDRVVEYLVGDGPSNRYALICKQCQSHNGMAIREEFEYIAYRCCYCFYWNPARKQKPTAPKLESAPLITSMKREDSTESSTSASEEESDKHPEHPKKTTKDENEISKEAKIESETTKDSEEKEDPKKE